MRNDTINNELFYQKITPGNGKPKIIYSKTQNTSHHNQKSLFKNKKTGTKIK